MPAGSEAMAISHLIRSTTKVVPQVGIGFVSPQTTQNITDQFYVVNLTIYDNIVYYCEDPATACNKEISSAI